MIEAQRGLLLLRTGDLEPAGLALDSAIDLLARRGDHLAAVLLNRSWLRLQRNQVRLAASDLTACVRLAEETGQGVLRAKALHNLGYASFLMGDLVAALLMLDEAGVLLAVLSPANRGVSLLDRARVLQDTGLLAEAEETLREAITVLATNRLDRDLAEAELTRAEVALSGGRYSDASKFGRTAARRFRQRGDSNWARVADVVLLQASLAAGRSTSGLSARAAVIAEELDRAGLAEDARSAYLLGLRASLVEGGLPEPPALRRGERIGLRLHGRLVRAEVAAANGKRQRRDAELRAGLGDLDRHRSRFGSLDLASAAALHGRELVRLGLCAAVEDGRPSVIHNWIERTRAVSLRLAPVRPPADPLAAEELAELRAVRAALRAAELGAPSDPGLAARRAQLERAVRQRSWLAVGGARLDDRQARLGEVRASVGVGCLVSYLAVDGMVHAVVATGRAARVVRLAALDDVRSDLRRVRSDLDAAALSQVPLPLRRSVHASLASGLRRLDERLWSPLARWAGDGPLVVVPTGSLAAVPWTMLPGLRGRPLTLAPSATWWLARRRLGPPGGPVVVVAGPGLKRADDEVNAVAKEWPGSTMLTGPDATAAAVLDAAVDAGVLHLAAHGRHEPDNPLFSAIELSDGPLFGYDLPRAAALPPHVVLSACDLGLVVERPGDESLGMTSALLHGGVSSVVAGVARVNDDVACQLMIAYHAALRSGRTPSVALADALAATGSDKSDQPAPFVVIGAGW